MKGMGKISISFLDAGIIQWQLKQLHEIKIWNILLRGHNSRVYCSVSGEAKVGDCHCCKLGVGREILFATSKPGFLWYSLHIFMLKHCKFLLPISCQRMAFMHYCAFILCNFIKTRVQEIHQEHCSTVLHCNNLSNSKLQCRTLLAFSSWLESFLPWYSRATRAITRWVFLEVGRKALKQLRQWSYKIIKLFTL